MQQPRCKFCLGIHARRFVNARGELVEEFAVLSNEFLVFMLEIKTCEDGVVGIFKILSELAKNRAILIIKSWHFEIGDIIHGEFSTMALAGNLACGSGLRMKR